ncbi:uncharacterized protein LOC141588337 [Silene latifolia]|uniref:uncharacterized protein LOC141588337 n=1 Tax=Silene latifolia TaxID=37657 RepID=UPI003D76E5F8
MFQLVKKLKALKPVLKQLNRLCFSDIENSTNITSSLLEHIQKYLIDKPGNLELIQKEMEVAHELRELMKARDSFLAQKAKLQWSLEGDINIAFFHNVIKRRIMLNKVLMIEDKNGQLCTEGDQIQGAFLEYYTKFLGTQMPTVPVNALFSIPKEKSPGPDGFSSQFYKDAWELVGSELLCNRLSLVLPDVVSRNQGAFIQGRSILENIIICQDLVRIRRAAYDVFRIPIQASRLTKDDCNILIDKVVSKIRGIGARKLSYAGRVTLINSVFNTLHNYWASIFLIPKGVIKRIEAICRNYLWEGETEFHRIPLVAWQKVCYPKKNGSLGIKEAGVWNIASVGKLVN